MTHAVVQRGHIYRVAFDTKTTVLGLVVSADWLNSQSNDYATVQVTSASTDQTGLPGSVRLNSGDPTSGWVVCRDIGMVHLDELTEDIGPISLDTEIQVNHALKRVLGL